MIENKYRERTATKPSPCFVCFKSTSTVLESSNDFFFVCPNHVKDSTFCKSINPPVPTISTKPEKINENSESKQSAKTESSLKTEAPVQIIFYQIHSSFVYLREKSIEEKLNNKRKIMLLKKLDSM